jgi:hypothetical protein
MGTTGLNEALSRGAPLVEVTVTFRADVDPIVATERINRQFSDFDLYPRPWYDDARLRVGSATKEALERLFGWRLKRVPLERYDKATGTWSHWTDCYRWEEINQPVLDHAGLGEMIESIGMSQPGADDDGQWCE